VVSSVPSASWRLPPRRDAAWFAAEEAVERAVVRSGCGAEHEPLLTHAADACSRLVWHGGGTTRERGQAPDLRVRDWLEPSTLTPPCAP
jgi:hypothetical protein